MGIVLGTVGDIGAISEDRPGSIAACAFLFCYVGLSWEMSLHSISKLAKIVLKYSILTY
jgi:hypothetical protein